MRKTLHRTLLILAITLAGFHANAQSGDDSEKVIMQLQKEALSSDMAWNLLVSLTSEIGPRMGIERDVATPAGGGADVGQMRILGLAVVDLNQDASRYFDLYHTANDMLDKVNPDNLRQNLAAWVTFVYVAANSTVDFGPVEPSG